MGASSPRQARWHEFISKFDLHVVDTPSPVTRMGDFLSRWAHRANLALGDVSIHGTAQADGDVRDMTAAVKEGLPPASLCFWWLWRPLSLDVALKRRPGLLGHLRVSKPLRLRL